MHERAFSNRALLLDVDGVLIQSNALKNLVCRRAARFVTKTVRVSRRDGTRINQVMYKTFGHTVQGMKVMYEDDDNPIRMDAFNELVYDVHALSALRDNTNKEDARLHRVLWRCHQRRVPVYLFSNAPKSWVMTYVETLRIPEELLPPARILTGDHPLVVKHGLKPSRDTYAAVGDLVRADMTCHNPELVFVDDSLTNLVPLLNAEVSGWIPVLFSPDRKHSVLGSRKLVQIYDLDQVLRLAFP
jgi:beta-phosphoglucomutase-like phosphatase (HAD superfamily)